MNRSNPTPAARAILALFALALLLAAAPAIAEPQVDWRPPPFELTDADGVTFHYPQDLDGPTIVLFWATWCPYCKALMPHLQSIVDEYAGTIKVLAPDFRDDGNPAEVLAELGYDFRLFPASDAVADAWGVKGTPGLFLADASGRVVFSNFSIPPEAYGSDPADTAQNLKHYQKAARRAPVWAAELRKAIDRIDH
jgi:thiol-disulfide isomerase/thioredoxin